MTEKSTSKNDVWYSFFFTLADCGHAAIIRCFLAPAYIPYIAEACDIDDIPSPSGWFEYFEEKAGGYIPENEGRASAKETFKKRLKSLGTYLCNAVKEDYGIDCSAYLGKNRNIIEFPEKFFRSVFTAQGTTALNDMWSCYLALLEKLYDGLTGPVPDTLAQLQEINAKTEWLHVPVPTSESTDPIWRSLDNIAYLLSTFALLSAARQIELENKNGIHPSDKTGIFRKVQAFLEIPGVPEPDAIPPLSGTSAASVSGGTFASTAFNTAFTGTAAPGHIAVSVQELISLCTAALSASSPELLQTIYNICTRSRIVLKPGSSDALASKGLLNKIRLCEQNLISSMNQASASVIYDTVKELNFLVEIEKYWKNL